MVDDEDSFCSYGKHDLVPEGGWQLLRLPREDTPAKGGGYAAALQHKLDALVDASEQNPETNETMVGTPAEIVTLIQQLGDCSAAREVGDEAIVAIEHLLCDEGEDVTVSEEAIESLPLRERTALFGKLCKLRKKAKEAIAEQPGLGSQLADAERELRQAPSHRRAHAEHRVKHCERRLRSAIVKRCRQLRDEHQLARVRAIEWRVYNAKMELYMRKQQFSRSLRLQPPCSTE